MASSSMDVQDTVVPLLVVSEPGMSRHADDDPSTWGVEEATEWTPSSLVDWDAVLSEEPPPDPDDDAGAAGAVSAAAGLIGALPWDPTELKRLARRGAWAGRHGARARVYAAVLDRLPCRPGLPDEDSYRGMLDEAVGGLDAEKLPVFAQGMPCPVYHLNASGQAALCRVLAATGRLFPALTHCPALPAVAALLLHYARDEARCFAGVARLLSCCSGSARCNKHFLDQTHVASAASALTFGDLARRHAPGAHALLSARGSPYADWLHWLLGDLPFPYAVRLLDSYLLEGDKVLYRASLGLLKEYKSWRASAAAATAVSDLPAWYGSDGGGGGSGGSGPGPDPAGEDAPEARAAVHAFARGLAAHGCPPERLMERAFNIRLFSRREMRLLHDANERALRERGVQRISTGRDELPGTVDVSSFCSAVVTAAEMRSVWSWIPERHALYSPRLLFSTLEHGCSLTRFYANCKEHEPTILLIKTMDNEVLGAFLSSAWSERNRATMKAGSFFGTGECFVFTVRPEIRRHQWVVIRSPQGGLDSPLASPMPSPYPSPQPSPYPTPPSTPPSSPVPPRRRLSDMMEGNACGGTGGAVVASSSSSSSSHDRSLHQRVSQAFANCRPRSGSTREVASQPGDGSPKSSRRSVGDALRLSLSALVGSPGRSPAVSPNLPRRGLGGNGGGAGGGDGAVASQAAFASAVSSSLLFPPAAASRPRSLSTPIPLCAHVPSRHHHGGKIRFNPTPSPPALLCVPSHSSFAQEMQARGLGPSAAPLQASQSFQMPAKAASMFMAGTPDSIVIGGGGGFALCLDAELLHGRSEACDTFANPPLSSTQDFTVQVLEVWALRQEDDQP
ncbi:uncharacterized protein LOC116946214 isoform X2 [Petromyzon marinus]|uniref:uncharacterized protein LOC116946214 isoform X2 n=1 Tax=Petromyzon marinus TaxID=7757 RepID=UPI003F70F1E2